VVKRQRPSSPGLRIDARLSNPQICALALWALGGATSPQDTEDVAVKCFELAPSRFSWKAYPYPSLEAAGVGLRDGKKPKHGALFSGFSRSGWLLTSSGIEWAQEAQHLLVSAKQTVGALGIRLSESAALNELRSHTMSRAWTNIKGDVGLFEIADAVQLSADAPRRIVSQRILELSNMAKLSGQQELLEYLAWLTSQLDKAH